MNATIGSALAPEQVQQYHRDGVIIVRDVFTATDIAELDSDAQRLMQRTDLMDSDNIRCRWQNCVATGACRFDCFDPVIDISPTCARVARDHRLLDIVSALYGERAHLFKDKLIFKPSGAQGYAMHQDYISWPSFPRSFVTAIVAIDASGATNGATEVFPGYHTLGSLVPEDGMYHEVPLNLLDLSKGVVLELNPGDVAVFSGFTPHRSGPNNSPLSRRLLYLSYNANSDGGDQRDAHYREYEGWLKDRYAEFGKTNTFFR
jgi:ectoine hydroxylase-related dioxygenase (phytanoyl-CoA dioxygenase family)